MAALNTPLIHLVRPPEQPLQLAWWTEVSGPIAFGPDGRLSDPSLEARSHPTGRSPCRPTALLRMDEDPDLRSTIDLVVEPLLLDQLARMADGYERSDGTTVPRRSTARHERGDGAQDAAQGRGTQRRAAVRDALLRAVAAGHGLRRIGRRSPSSACPRCRYHRDGAPAPTCHVGGPSTRRRDRRSRARRPRRPRGRRGAGQRRCGRPHGAAERLRAVAGRHHHHDVRRLDEPRAPRPLRPRPLGRPRPERRPRRRCARRCWARSPRSGANSRCRATTGRLDDRPRRGGVAARVAAAHDLGPDHAPAGGSHLPRTLACTGLRSHGESCGTRAGPGRSLDRTVPTGLHRETARRAQGRRGLPLDAGRGRAPPPTGSTATS